MSVVSYLLARYDSKLDKYKFEYIELKQHVIAKRVRLSTLKSVKWS